MYKDYLSYIDESKSYLEYLDPTEITTQEALENYLRKLDEISKAVDSKIEETAKKIVESKSLAKITLILTVISTTILFSFSSLGFLTLYSYIFFTIIPLTFVSLLLYSSFKSDRYVEILEKLKEYKLLITDIREQLSAKELPKYVININKLMLGLKRLEVLYGILYSVEKIKHYMNNIEVIIAEKYLRHHKNIMDSLNREDYIIASKHLKKALKNIEKEAHYAFSIVKLVKSFISRDMYLKFSEKVKVIENWLNILGLSIKLCDALVKNDRETLMEIYGKVKEYSKDTSQLIIGNVNVFVQLLNTLLKVLEKKVKIPHGIKRKVVIKPKAKTFSHVEAEKEVPRFLFTGFPEELIKIYEPLEFLGEGGFAKVFKVRKRKTGEIVALKIPKLDEKTSKIFLRELAAWFNLNHKNIVKLHGADIFPIPYIEMEYVEGVKVDNKVVRTLDEYPKPVDEKLALKIVKEIAEGLKHAHSRGVIHRDLKPLNVLLKSDLTPKITDFGLAKLSALSSRSTVKGYSPLYAAPEQIDEKTYGSTDERTDIYQLGLIFYELLTGRLPYEGTTPAAVLAKIVNPEIQPHLPSTYRREYSKYDGIFRKLLAKRKEDRFQSVDEFLASLRKLEEAEDERRKLKDTLKKSISKMKESTSIDEYLKLRKEVLESLTKIAVLSAKLNDKVELIKTLNDVKFYTKEHLKDVLEMIKYLELLDREKIPLSEDMINRIEILMHKILRENFR